MAKLIDQQKAERRGRILGQVRQCFVERGYDAVTMKELAEAGGVSVPTLYNRFGGKDELLFAAVEDQFIHLLGGLGTAWSGSGARAVFAVLEACNNMLLGAPGYARTLLGLLAQTGARQVQSTLMRAMLDQLTAAIGRAKASGDLVEWVEPTLLAERIRDSYVMLAFGWGLGERNDEGLRQGSEYLGAISMIGVAGADTLAAELRRRAQVAQVTLLELAASAPVTAEAAAAAEAAAVVGADTP